jgi:hypothetical protein
MANKFFGAISHIGGADGDLDLISKDIISDGDGAFVLDKTNNTIDFYTLDSASNTDEDGVNFTIVKPDDEAAKPGKRWIKLATRSWDGSTAEAGTTVTLLATQTMTNKTLTAPTITAATITGATITTPIITTGLLAKAGETAIGITADGAVDLYYDNIKEAETESGVFKATNAFTIGAEQDITAFTGADLSLVTGTAGTSGNLSQWNADGDLVDTTLTAASIPEIDEPAEWTAQQNFAQTAITSSGNSVAWATDANQITRHVLTENTTIAEPTQKNNGGVYYLVVEQAAGLYTLAWNAAFKWGEAATPVAPAASGDTVLFAFFKDTNGGLMGIEVNRQEA